MVESTTINGEAQQGQRKLSRGKDLKNNQQVSSEASETGLDHKMETKNSKVISKFVPPDPISMDIEVAGGSKTKPKKPPALKSVRYYVMALALMCPFVVTYSRTIINFAITDMIDPEFVEVKNKSNESDKVVLVNGTTPYFDLDHSCPVTDADERTRLLEEMKHDTERAQSNSGDKFKWDTFKQGLLKAAYAIGHTPFQIPGSRLSELYGSQRVLSIGAFLITICCLIAPYLAALNFYLLFADLILLGIWGSFMTPALITLFANWLTPSEKSVLISFYLIASRLGYALSSILCGSLIQAQYSWRYVFFSAGWISLTFGTCVFFGTRSRPQDHPFIGELELEYLASKNTLVKEGLEQRKRFNEKLEQDQELKEITPVIVVGDRSTKESTNGHVQAQKQSPIETTTTKSVKKTSAPWLAIVTNIHVIAFVVTKFCVKLSTDTIQIELPSYLKRVMHFSSGKNGTVNALNYVMFCGGCFGVGALTSKMSKSKPFGFSKTAIRKIFQCTSSFGVSILLIGIAFSVCDNISTQVYLLLLFVVTTFGIGGEAQQPMDLSERYSGTLHALASSLAISGVIEPTLVGYLMKGHPADRDSWKFVWLGASAISFFGGMFFLIFGDANIQPFDNLNKEEEEEKETKKSIEGKDNKSFEVDNSDPATIQERGEEQQQQETSHRESIQI